jgi:soluble lytic murein transglycosylase-like protein
MIKISLLTLSIITILFFSNYEKLDHFEKIESNFYKDVNDINSSNSMKMYESIEKYSDLYNVPKYIAYNIAYKETRYKGPFHWSYKHYQESYGGALGPMQILLSTANSPYFSGGKKIKAKDLMNDIDLNVEISMRILRRNFEKTGNWKLACGMYNTGKAVINDYAIYCATNKNYKNKWVKY